MPENIILMPLPPYAPQLNPTENIWEFLRGPATIMTCGRSESGCFAPRHEPSNFLRLGEGSNPFARSKIS